MSGLTWAGGDHELVATFGVLVGGWRHPGSHSIKKWIQALKYLDFPLHQVGE